MRPKQVVSLDYNVSMPYVKWGLEWMGLKDKLSPPYFSGKIKSLGPAFSPLLICYFQSYILSAIISRKPALTSDHKWFNYDMWVQARTNYSPSLSLEEQYFNYLSTWKDWENCLLMYLFEYWLHSQACFICPWRYRENIREQMP